MAALVQDAPSGLALALHLALLPYNVFLCAALWRIPDRNPLAALIAVGWMVAMTLV